MTNLKPSLIAISAAFILVTAVIYGIDLQLAKSSTQQSYVPYSLYSIVTLMALYGLTVFLFIRETGIARKKQEQLEQELSSVTDTLNDVQSSLDDAVEKKTFEMSLINGSLNREIAERIQAEAEGLKLRKRLHAILNSAGEGIFGIDTKGVVTFVNHKATELLGWTKEELIGTSHHDLVHHTRKTGMEYPVEECPIYMAYKDGDIHYESDDVFWTKSGRSFPVEYSSTPLLAEEMITGAVVVFKDVSKAKKMEKQLELILNSAGEGIFGLDVEGNVTFMNKAASIMLGWKSEELIGKSHHELVHHSHSDGSRYREEECPIYMACKDGQVHFKSDDVFWAKDGSKFTVEYNSTPIVEGGKFTGAVVMFRDTSTFA
ncbi:MAG: PAS domain-containing protein [Thermodesulfobacteriota bacterium]